MGSTGSFFSSTPCPCGSGRAFPRCCEPALRGSPVATAEALMRSRYVAFVLQDEPHLLASWHPTTRPESVGVGAQDWLGLDVLETVDGGPSDDTGVVEFEATFRDADEKVRILHERSSFLREGGRWLYVGPEDAAVL